MMTKVDGGSFQGHLPCMLAHTNCSRLTRELEKKLSDKYIVFLSQRRVLAKPARNSSASKGQKRPRSRTLTAVHEKMLEDLVFPSEIVGKRTRVAADGGKLIRV
jgi:small subunit ribosomal protein S7e